MRYRELIAEDYSIREPEYDRVDTADINDTRKPRLTLKMLNHLKKSRLNKIKELEKTQDVLSIMYANADDEGIG